MGSSLSSTANGLNTLEYAERLIRAGVPEEQAKAQALVLYEIINSTLATKRDIKELEDKIALKFLLYSSGVIGGSSSVIIGTIFTLAKLGLLSIH